MQHDIHISTMIECASDSCLAVLFYRKGVTKTSLKPRLIEPYSFAQGKQDLMIKAFQLNRAGDTGESGWRFFMSHKVEAVEKTNVRFKPRRPITLPTGEVTESYGRSEHWEADGRRIYRDFVGDALADGKLDPGEIFDIEGIRQKHRLTDDDIRYVHASVYQRCLGAVLDDGFVTEDEVEQIRFLHRALRCLGWAVGD